MPNKTYYWLKLCEHFFDQPTMKYLERVPDGYRITVIYLKLLLVSLHSNGYIWVEKIYPGLEENLELVLNEPKEVISLALRLFESMQLMTTGTGDWDLYMVRIPEMVGTESETDSARRMRALRQRKRMESSFVERERHIVQKCDTEKDIDIEREQELEILPAGRGDDL